MDNIKKLLDQIDLVRDDMALGLMSDPGMSKTSQVKQWAKEHGRNYVEIIISQRMPSEISGMPMPIAESKTMEIFDYNTLLDLKDGDVLAFDEFTNGNIMTLNACLTLIQERTMISGKKLPSVLIVAMGNPQGKCDLLPQTKQRFIWYNVKPDYAMWCRYILDKYDINLNRSILMKDIIEQYKSGFKYDDYNYMTFRSAENIIKLVKNMLDSGMEIDQIRDHPIFSCFYSAHAIKEICELFKCARDNKEFLDKRNKLNESLIEFGFHTEANTIGKMKMDLDSWLQPIIDKQLNLVPLTPDEIRIMNILGLSMEE